MSEVPARERLLWENDSLRHSVERGLAQASDGQVGSRDDYLVGDGVSDHINELLGIDLSNPVQALACKLTDEDFSLVCKLSATRKSAGLTLEEVAERMGTTPNKVRALEGADSDPRLSTLRRYALALGVLVTHHIQPEESA